MAIHSTTVTNKISSITDEASSVPYVGRYDRAYFYSFLISLVLCWSPSKLVGYLAPLVALVWFLLATKSHVSLRNLSLVLVAWLTSVLVHALLTPDFALHSALLSLLTYGSFLFIIMVPGKSVGGRKLLRRMTDIARWVVLFQGSWGIVQGLMAAARTGTFDGATGDAVAGTIRPFAVTPDLSNPIFAINMAFLLIVLLPSLVRERKGKLAYSIGVISLILASVMHVLLFLTAAFVIAFLIFYPTFFLRKAGCLLLVGFLIAAAFATTILSGNFATIRNFAQHTIEGQTPRAKVVVRASTTMPKEYPWMPFIGLGPGQFSSRASLIGTGLYFGTPANPKPLPLLSEGMSEPFEKYIFDLWISLFFDRYGNYVHTMNNTSSTVQPFFSWLSFYTELGAVAFAGLLIYCVWLLLRVRRFSQTPKQRLRASSFSAAIIFLFLLGLQENYWEVSQAIFIGLVFLKVQYSNLLYDYS